MVKGKVTCSQAHVLAWRVLLVSFAFFLVGFCAPQNVDVSTNTQNINLFSLEESADPTDEQQQNGANNWQQVLKATYREVIITFGDISTLTGSQDQGNNRNNLTDNSNESQQEMQNWQQPGVSDEDREDERDIESAREDGEREEQEEKENIDDDDDDDDDENDEEDEENEEQQSTQLAYTEEPFFVGVAYDLPIQLRPREGGGDPGYLKLILDETVYNDLLNTIKNDAEEDNDAQNQPPAVEKKPQKNGVFLMCYVKDPEEFEKRFDRALSLGEGVYVPLQRMTDFARHRDFTVGNPGMQDVQLSNDHYTSSITEWDEKYFNKLKKLKKKTGLKIGGMWFGPPDYEAIDRLLKQYPDVFDGVYFNWEDGQGSCMNNLGRPPKLNADGTKTYWADKPEFFFRYFMGGQDGDVCKIADGRSYIRDVPVNVGRELTLPDGVSPVFPCFGGNEGFCYKAFSKFLEAACDSNLQRYSFARYDRYSDRMRLMLEEGCKNLGLPVPAMDFVGAV